MATPNPIPAGLLSLQALYLEQAKISRAMLATTTRDGYAFDLKAFRRWCDERNLDALPATSETISLFVTDLLARRKKTSTVRRLLAGVVHAHRAQGHALDLNREFIEMLLEGAKRVNTESLEQVKPFTVEDVRAMSVSLLQRPNIRTARNRALIVVGFCLALRSASLVDLDLADVELDEKLGALVHVRREKNDQAGKGRFLGLVFGKHPETCPVQALKEWLRYRADFSGPLFTHVRQDLSGAVNHRLKPKTIYAIVKKELRRAGLDPSGFGSHSMRAGLVTAAGEAGVSDLAIAAHTGHRDTDMVRRYFRKRDAFRGNILAHLDI